MKNLAKNLTEQKSLFENERQSLIYLALLEEGPMGAEIIRKKTGLHREIVQRELKKMAGTGIVRLLANGRKKKAEAIPVKSLQEKLQGQVTSFDKLLAPLLEAQTKKNSPTIKVFSGDRAFALLQSKLFCSQPKKTTVKVLSTQPKAYVTAMQEAGRLESSEKLRLKKEIGFDLLVFDELKGEVEENDRLYFYNQPLHLRRKVRYVSGELSSPLQIQIWQGVVLISIFSSSPSLHIYMEDLRICHAMEAYFKIIWGISQK